MFAYSVAKGTAGDFTTHATPGTETGVYAILVGATKAVSLSEIMCGGKNVDQTALNAIELRIMTVTTASTGGTAITPSPRQGAPASVASGVNGQTISATGRANHGAFSFSGTGQGGYVAADEASMVQIAGNSGDSIDILSASGKASMLHTTSCVIKEY